MYVYVYVHVYVCIYAWFLTCSWDVLVWLLGGRLGAQSCALEHNFYPTEYQRDWLHPTSMRERFGFQHPTHKQADRHLNTIEIEIRNNRDSWDSPLDARIRGLPLVHRHCPTRMGNPCMRGLLLHSPRHQQQLRRGAPRPAEGGAAAVDAGGVQQQPAQARISHSHAAMPVHEREPA